MSSGSEDSHDEISEDKSESNDSGSTSDIDSDKISDIDSDPMGDIDSDQIDDENKQFEKQDKEIISELEKTRKERRRNHWDKERIRIEQKAVQKYLSLRSACKIDYLNNLNYKYRDWTITLKEYDDLTDHYDHLRREYSELNDKLYSINEQKKNYDKLDVKYYRLSENFGKLNREKNKLQEDYDELKKRYDDKVEEIKIMIEYMPGSGEAYLKAEEHFNENK